jgi:hypothetical protein
MNAAPPRLAGAGGPLIASALAIALEGVRLWQREPTVRACPFSCEPSPHLARLEDVEGVRAAVVEAVSEQEVRAEAADKEGRERDRQQAYLLISTALPCWAPVVWRILAACSGCGRRVRRRVPRRILELEDEDTSEDGIGATDMARARSSARTLQR